MAVPHAGLGLRLRPGAGALLSKGRPGIVAPGRGETHPSIATPVGAFATSNTVTPATVPGAPQIGTAASGGPNAAVTATATWAAPASNGGTVITGYRVTALRIAGDGSDLATVESGVLGANARSLLMTLPAGNYQFQVVAINAVGTSLPSARSNQVIAQ